MKDSWRTALKVGLACAAVIFAMYVLMSARINSDLDDYYNKPHEWISDDVGFFWMMAFFALSNVVLLASGPAAALAARKKMAGDRKAVAGPAIAVAAAAVLSIAAILTYEAILSAGNLLPYFRDIFTWQITPAGNLCLPVYFLCGLVSVFIGIAAPALKKL